MKYRTLLPIHQFSFVFVVACSLRSFSNAVVDGRLLLPDPKSHSKHRGVLVLYDGNVFPFSELLSVALPPSPSGVRCATHPSVLVRRCCRDVVKFFRG